MNETPELTHEDHVMRPRTRWLAGILAVSFGLAGCGRQDPSEEPSKDASAVAKKSDDASPECCEIDRGKLLVAQGEGGGAMRNAPMFGGSPSRNMVNLVDKDLPTEWSS